MKKTHLFRTALVLGLSIAIQSANAGDVDYSLQLQPHWAAMQDGQGAGSDGNGYLEVSRFYNVREAYSNVEAGEWELEVEGAWEKFNDSDDFSTAVSIKYGYTDTLHIELELMSIELFEGGGRGAGDLELLLFNQFTGDTGDSPAFAAWIAARFPTGDGSNGIDGELHLNFTKDLGNGWRGHLEGFGKVNDGERGDGGGGNDFFDDDSGFFGDDDDRRSFQWGVGVGFDYQCGENGLGIINYLNESSELEGNARVQTLELGYVHHLNADEALKFAFDINLDGHDASGDFAAKIQWALEF